MGFPGVIPFKFPGVERVSCGFGTRLGGVSGLPFNSCNISYDVGDDPEAVEENRNIIKERLKFSHWVENTQVHGDRTIFEPDPTGTETPGGTEADGLATSRPGLALVVKTADCQPILIAHEKGKFVAGLHVGWRGNVIGYPQTAVQDICEYYKVSPKELLAVRGPSLGPSASQFVNFNDEFGPKFADYHNQADSTVNLWRLTRDQLKNAGLAEDRIYSIDICTYSVDRFFSFRRKKDTGRQGAFIWIAAPA